MQMNNGFYELLRTVLRNRINLFVFDSGSTNWSASGSNNSSSGSGMFRAANDLPKFLNAQKMTNV
jgi:hypothetical protein